MRRWSKSRTTCDVVDSSGSLEYFADGPSADFFATSIGNVRELVVSLDATLALRVASISADSGLPMANSVQSSRVEIINRSADGGAAGRHPTGSFFGQVVHEAQIVLEDAKHAHSTPGNNSITERLNVCYTP
jgi:hypothetical protein